MTLSDTSSDECDENTLLHHKIIINFSLFDILFSKLFHKSDTPHFHWVCWRNNFSLMFSQHTAPRGLAYQSRCISCCRFSPPKSETEKSRKNRMLSQASVGLLRLQTHGFFKIPTADRFRFVRILRFIGSKCLGTQSQKASVDCQFCASYI